jgi:membrane protease YdiL (CAAX protease family)
LYKREVQKLKKSKGKNEKNKKADKTSEKKMLGNGRFLNFTQDSYLERTSRPICAVIFLLPFMLFYELGTFRYNTYVVYHLQERVKAFVWLQDMLELIGFGGKFAWAAPPLAVVVILLSLQITSRKKWSFWFKDYFLMVIECVLLAVPLIVLVLLMNSISSRHFNNNLNSRLESQYEVITASSSISSEEIGSSNNEQTAAVQKHSLVADIVTGIGAGIYEELVFRLILICILMVFFQDLLRLTHTNSIVLSIIISAALFSAYHHVDFFSGRPNISDPFDITKFTFRTIAGVYFAILFAIRGFGINAGTHAFYNIIAVTVRVVFFSY